MARRKRPKEVPERVVASVTGLDTTYFLTLERPGEDTSAHEEAIIYLNTEIRWISKRHKQHLGRHFDIQLITSAGAREKPDHCKCFGSIALKKVDCGAYVYLPAVSFYGLRSLINFENCFVDLEFDPIKWGHGSLSWVSITNEQHLFDLPGFPYDDLVEAPR